MRNETLAKVFGIEAELTVRGDRDFTISTETVCPDLLDRVRAFFGNEITNATAEHDDECGTFVYFTVA
jgi:hypothetical protein